MKVESAAPPAYGDAAQGVPGVGPGVAPGVPQVVFVPSQPPVQNVQSTDCCICSPPADSDARMTYHLSIAVVVTHTVALLALGFVLWAQWLGSLSAIIAGSLALGIHTKVFYIAAGIFYIVAAIFDFITTIVWFSYGGSFAFIGIFPLMGLISAVPATVFAFKACGKLEEPPIPQELPVVGVGVGVFPPPVTSHEVVIHR